jgi:hypothetical protein
LKAKEVEVEIDYDAQDKRAYAEPEPDDSPDQALAAAGVTHTGLHENQMCASEGPSYRRHEIEGIGGVVKGKLVTIVKVGQCVGEFEDERGRDGETGHLHKWLERERRGLERSFCAWCMRIVPSDAELTTADGTNQPAVHDHFA